MIYLLIILAVILVWVIATYNFFVSAKTRIKASVQEIGNQLKRQADLIPNLEEAAKGYLSHEKAIFLELTAARKSVAAAAASNDVNKMAVAGKMLSEVLPKIQVVVESNPQLKGAEVVTDLMNELRDTADKVMYACRLLIDLTADFNVKRVSFPASLIAGVFRFEELPGLITEEKETKTPKVKL